MNILVISSILPIESALASNDFIFRLYGNYRSLFPDDRIVIIRPVKYDLNIRTILRGETRLQKLKGRMHWNIDNFEVEIFPFFAAWSIRNLHALVSRSIYYVNRKRINGLFRKYHFDVIHARFIFSDGILAYLISKKFEIPFLVSTHNEMFYFEHFYSRIMALRILHHASFVLPASYTNLIAFKKYNIRNVVQQTHGFYNSFVKAQRKKSTETVSILTVCKLIKLKNIDQVLKAFYRLKSSYNFKYTVIGTGPEKGFLQSLVDSLGLQDSVSFIDHVSHDHIADEMYKHDIFIMPSYFETFGRVYFEVMAMGMPIICAKNSGIYGLYKEKEEGFSVDHRSISEIAEALEYLIDNREVRLRVGRNGQKLVKNFTWENIVKDLHQKYLDSIQKIS